VDSSTCSSRRWTTTGRANGRQCSTATQSPKFRTAAGVVPIQGTEPDARRDALARVPAFLDRHLRQ
jgi:hypothetical protein